MEFNTSSGVPIWRQVADHLVDRIRTGDLAVGDRVPSTRELADRLNVAMSTALKALGELRDQGLIRTDRGQGSFVAKRPMLVRVSSRRYRNSADGVSPTAAEFKRQNEGITLAGRASVERASARVARRLSIAEGDPVSRIDYFWRDERGPIQRSTQWEPLAVTGGTSIEIPPESGHPDVIARFAGIGVRVTRVLEETHSRMPTAAESGELEIGEGIPVFYLERTHLADGLPVETADITIRGDRMTIATEHIVSEGEVDAG